jgi:hypothetical protein
MWTKSGLTLKQSFVAIFNGNCVRRQCSSHLSDCVSVNKWIELHGKSEGVSSKSTKKIVDRLYQWKNNWYSDNTVFNSHGSYLSS